MNQKFKGWGDVAERLRILADDRAIELNDGQAASIRELATRLPENGVIIADEVGMGKTRIATAVARSVIAAGGRVAILVPPGLGYQWSDELNAAGVDAPPILRSLDSFLNAWKKEDNKHIQPWALHSALLISHAFCNWQVKSNTKHSWKWSLLPKTLSLIQAGLLRESGKLPKGTKNNTELECDLRITECANWIFSNSSKRKLREIAERDGFNKWGGDSPLLKPDSYLKHTEYRQGLENIIGLGLGDFDLVIIDEAHKNRGAEGNLERLLKHVVAITKNIRSLAMTATPVELDATQWMQILGRIRVDEKPKETATAAIACYAEAVTKVRQCPSDLAARKQYLESATVFKAVLNPYLLRRDKREDPAVIKFKNASGESYHAYRREKEIPINTAQLTPEWKQAVCAAEALSFVTYPSDPTIADAKRLRLTIGNGHGISKLIDEQLRHDTDDHKQSEADDDHETNRQLAGDRSLPTDKRLQRATWWQEVMSRPFASNGSALFYHPAILAAVEEIEGVCRHGEKVLVFGRFTRPLRALVQLLNAREMLRCVDEKQLWPQSKVHGNEEWTATLAAHRQLKRPGGLDRNLLDNSLAEKYQDLENQRRSIRVNLIHIIEGGLNIKQPDKRVWQMFEAFKKTATEVSEQDQDNSNHDLAIVARAVQELAGVSIVNADSTNFAQAFIDLVAAASDRDEGDADGDGLLDETEASDLWSTLKLRLHEEYNRPEGGFARLMYGETKPATRRFLQLAFNRKQGHPKVLVAQSLVGREGLNLHKACRTVVLLHPEWNPGVVEQQIGRVDRIGSLWEEQLNQAIANKQANCDLPRIEVRPVVFQGTYDEKNWQVLHDRWDDLRAQLHGIVISPRIAEKYWNTEEMVAGINDAAPNFSPTVKE